MNIPLPPLRFLRYAEQQYPRRTAVVCDQHNFTYTEFADRAARLAGALREAGIQAGDRVAFLSTNCHRLLEAYYGVLEAGAVLLPLNIRLAAHEIAYILNDSGAKMLLLEGQFEGMVESFRPELTTVEKFVMLDGPAQTGWVLPGIYEQLLEGARPPRPAQMSFVERTHGAPFY